MYNILYPVTLYPIYLLDINILSNWYCNHTFKGLVRRKLYIFILTPTIWFRRIIPFIFLGFTSCLVWHLWYLVSLHRHFNMAIVDLVTGRFSILCSWGYPLKVKFLQCSCRYLMYCWTKIDFHWPFIKSLILIIIDYKSDRNPSRITFKFSMNGSLQWGFLVL